jgi:hypothetical protein
LSDNAGWQWRAYVKSWIENGKWKDNKEVKTQMLRYFDK